MKFIYKIFRIGVLISSSIGCTKFVQVPPPTTELVGSTVYSTNPTAVSAVTAIYLSMGGSNGPGGSVGGGPYGISALLGLSADEFTLYPTTDNILNPVYSNSIMGNSPYPPPIWADLYSCIYQANSAIEGISNSIGMTMPFKKQLTGEAEFIRAFCNFYLVNIYGDVPLIINTDYKINQVISRIPQAQVYQQIIADLKDAKNILTDDYLAPDGTFTSERVRPNKSAASALLARTYLYQQKWDSAEAEATYIINNSNYNLVVDLDSAFLANNTEAIWQLEMPNSGANAPDASAFLLSYYGGPNSGLAPFILSDSLVYNFEPGDLRLMHWVDSIIIGTTTYYFADKYKLYYTGNPPAEFPTLFRLSEQYLIRAEARAEQNNLTGASADLNIIRSRASLPNTTASSQQDLLASIYHERRFELFTEYGHRWLDIKRTGNINAVMNLITPQKGGSWKTTDQVYPIPNSDILADPNLTQNPGYN